MVVHLRSVGAIVGIAVAAFVLYGVVLDVDRGGVLRWAPVVEGAMTGAAVLAVWSIARTRRAAALGLVVAVVLVGGGAAGFGPALGFAQSPMGWATVLALLARIVAPESAPAAERRSEQVSP